MVYNHTKRAMVCQELELAYTFLQRFKGLMFRKNLNANKGLLLAHCKSVHMFFMRFPIDVVFLDVQCKVLGIERGLRPWQISRHYKSAFYALELPTGKAKDMDLGDVVELRH